VAGLSGVLFAGVLAHTLIGALRRAGVVKDRPEPTMPRRVYRIILIVAAVLTVAFGVFLRSVLQGPPTIDVSGAVEEPYEFPTEAGEMESITTEGTLRDVTRSYTGVPLREIIARAQPEENAEMVLVTASDGYAFFIGMDEVRSNENLLLAPQGQGDDASYNVVGAENSKAWVRSVSEMTVVGASTLEITGAFADPAAYDPDDWQFEMDAVSLDLGDGPQKVQGAPLSKVLASMSPTNDASTVALQTPEGDETLSLTNVLSTDKIRLFTVIRGDITYFFLGVTALGLMAHSTHDMGLIPLIIDRIAHGLAVNGQGVVVCCVSVVPVLESSINCCRINSDQDIANDILTGDKVATIFKTATKTLACFLAEASRPIRHGTISSHAT